MCKSACISFSWHIYRSRRTSSIINVHVTRYLILLIHLSLKKNIISHKCTCPQVSHSLDTSIAHGDHHLSKVYKSPGISFSWYVCHLPRKTSLIKVQVSAYLFLLVVLSLTLNIISPKCTSLQVSHPRKEHHEDVHQKSQNVCNFYSPISTVITLKQARLDKKHPQVNNKHQMSTYISRLWCSCFHISYSRRLLIWFRPRKQLESWHWLWLLLIGTISAWNRRWNPRL